MAGGDGLIKSPLQQNLRQQRLGVDVGALAEQQEADEDRDRIHLRDPAGHPGRQHDADQRGESVMPPEVTMSVTCCAPPGWPLPVSVTV